MKKKSSSKKKIERKNSILTEGTISNMNYGYPQKYSISVDGLKKKPKKK
jgi:hypothetical protein